MTPVPSRYLPLIIFFALFVLGYAVGQTGIPVEDGGEFLTVARLGGVNHPPGLPLVSLCSRVSWVLFGEQGLRVLFALFAAGTLFIVQRSKNISSLVFSAGLLLLAPLAGRLLIWDAYSPLILVFALALVRRPTPDLEGGYLTGLALAIHPQGILLPVLFRWKDVSLPRFAAGIILGISLYLALPVG